MLMLTTLGIPLRKQADFQPFISPGKKMPGKDQGLRFALLAKTCNDQGGAS
jgi:hypothetical protein